MTDRLSFQSLNAALRAVAEPTRLRILALLTEAELTVSDLMEILRQSQPRISRHLKLLSEAALIERHREGSWAFFRVADSEGRADIVRALTEFLDPDDSDACARPRAARRRAPGAGRRRAGLFQRACRRMGPHPQAACRRRCGRARDRRGARRQAVPLAARSRHRHGPHARIVRPAYRARARHRSLARHAVGRARAARSRGPEELQRAAGRHLRRRGAARFLRCRDHPSGAALSGRRRARDPRGGARADAVGPSAGGGFRAARSRIPARGARASPPRLCRRDRVAMARVRRPRCRQPSQHSRPSPARKGKSRCRSGLDAIRASCWRAAGRLPDGASVTTRPSRIGGVSLVPRLRVSFEFFPPKTEEMERTLWDSVERLAPLVAAASCRSPMAPAARRASARIRR